MLKEREDGLSDTERILFLIEETEIGETNIPESGEAGTQYYGFAKFKILPAIFLCIATLDHSEVKDVSHGELCYI